MSKILKHSSLPPFPTRADKEDWMLSPIHHAGTWHPMHQFSQYGEKLVTSTTTETDLAWDGVGSTILPANHFSYRGKMVESMTMWYWSKEASSDLTLRVRLGINWDTDMLWNNAVACTFQDTGDTVTITNHWFQNTKEIQFPSVSASFGVSINTTYYVRDKTTSTFRISTSKTGGTLITITANGTGTLKASTMIHQKFFDNTRLGSKVWNGGHWEIRTMTTCMTLWTLWTVNMHGTLSLYENDSAEIVGLHNENLVLQIDTTKAINLFVTAEWSASSADVKITSTNHMII